MTQNVKYKIDKHVIYKEAEDLVYILDVDGNKLRTLNDVASLIWKSLKTEKTVDELVAEIMEIYDASAIVIEKDCREFLEKYIQMGFVSKVLKK